MHRFSSLLRLRTIFFAAFCLPAFMSAGVEIDSHGWTQVAPSSDSRVVYVSNSTGDDSNDGLSPERALATIAAGNRLLRDGYPDQLLLRRGDTFTEAEVSTFGRWKNGRSLDEPLILGAYGTEVARPIIEVNNPLIDHDGDRRHYLMILGIDFYAPESDPTSERFTETPSPTALRLIGRGDGLHIEDCRFRYTNVVIQGLWDVFYRNVFFRRNIVFGAWINDSSTEGNSISGLFVNNIDGPCVVEENFFDQNGWNPTVADAGRSQDSHNVHFAFGSHEGLIFRGNISTRSSSHGVMADSGGIIERNLFAYNSIGATLGVPWWFENGQGYTFQNRAEENVILNGSRMSENEETIHQTISVFGLEAKLVVASFRDNVIANPATGGAVKAFNGASSPFTGSVIYGWDRRYNTAVDSTWPHPEADLADYYASVGGEQSVEAYLNWLRERPPGTLPWEMSAYAAIDYFRQGFNLSPVQGYYPQGIELPNIPAESLSLSPATITLVADLSTTLHPSLNPTNTSDQRLVWSSGNPEIARVNQYGQVTGLRAGITTITATTMDGKLSASAEVSVSGEAPLQTVAFGITATTLGVGESFHVPVRFYPDYADDTEVVWTSSAPGIATVDEDGIVTGLAVGRCSITATFPEHTGKAATYSLVIREEPTQWGEFARDIQGNVFTPDFLGWIIALRGNWIWSWNLQTHLYLDPEYISASGSWAYVPLTPPSNPKGGWALWEIVGDNWVSTDRDGGKFLGWLNVGKAPWIYSLALERWTYVREPSSSDTGAWVYFTRSPEI
jgi:hypothetical protein